MTNEVKEWLKLREDKISLTQIAKMYGMSRETLRRRLLSVGAFTGEFFKNLEFDKDTIIHQYQSGISISAIARENNCTRGTIARFLTKNNIATRDRDEQVQIEKGNGLRKTVNRNFFNSWSNEMAYVLGWITTDGCILSNLKSFHITSIDIDHLYKLSSLMETDVKITLYKGKGNARLAGKVFIGSKYMVKKLLNIGIIPRKTGKIQMPLVPDEYLSHFFRGVFEGDGTIFVRKGQAVLKVYNGSNGFLCELNRRISECLNIRSGSIYKVKGCNSRTLYFGSHERIVSLFDFMYSGVTENMILERKYNTFLEYLKLKGR